MCTILLIRTKKHNFSKVTPPIIIYYTLYMTENTLKTKLLAKQACYGVISPTADPTICEYLGLLGMQYYIIDAEHGAISITEAAHLIRACETVGITPLARIPSLDEKMILQYFDAGCMGVVMPGTNTVADCERLVQYVKYTPIGARGLGPVRSAQYMAGTHTQAQYIAYSNAHTMVLPMIETVECLHNLPSMVKVAGIDGFILGPRDLALSMGYLDGPNHPQVKEAIANAIHTVRQAGLIFGTVAANAEQAAELKHQGVTLLLNSVQGLLTPSVKAFMG